MRNGNGRGSVVKIGTLWYARWRIQGEDTYGDGRPDSDDAERDRLAGPPVEAQKVKKRDIPTLQVWAHECMSGRYGDRLAESTYDTNGSIRMKHVEGTAFGKKRLDKITRDDCQRFADGITKDKGGKPSPAWMRRVCAFVSRIFALAEREGYVKSNPMKGVELSEVEERENRVLSPEEASRLLNPQTRTDAIMLVAMMTGMRRGEILRLQWSHIQPTFIQVPGTKNKASRKPVPITSEVRDAIMAQPVRSLFVFSTDTGKPLSPRNVSRDVAVRRKALGLPATMRLHDLRGTFVSQLMEAGVDLRTVQELARHSDPRTTQGMYARSRTETRVAAIESLRGRVGKKPDDDASSEVA